MVKQILMLSGLLVGSFCVTFGVSHFLDDQKVAPPDPNKGPSVLSNQSPLKDLEKLTMKEHQLDDLIGRVRQRLKDLDAREQRLRRMSERVEMARKDLDTQATAMEDLRLSLAAPLKELKETRLALKQTRLRIRAAERDRLQEMAGVFARMDAMAGAETMTRMVSNGQEDDAAKILHYMEERSAAKVLAQIADKGTAADLVNRIKRITKDG